LGAIAGIRGFVFAGNAVAGKARAYGGGASDLPEPSDQQQRGHATTVAADQFRVLDDPEGLD
jgi:hypothetical protein